MMYTYDDLKTMQRWSLERKIKVSQTKIIEWVTRNQGKVYIAFSGGKDSTVLLDLVRRIYPDIPAVFYDTGLEYPEVRSFVVNKENVITLKPNLSFLEIITKNGYPVISKEVSKTIESARQGKAYAIERLNNMSKDREGNLSRYNYPKYKYLLTSDFKISDKCCYAMKKSAAYRYSRKTGQNAFVGTLAVESRRRITTWLTYGCNAFDKQYPTSQPLSFWTTQDILRYLYQFNIPYSSVYGEIKPVSNQCCLLDEELHTTGESRTGCMFCLFGVHLEKSPNRFERMKLSHPSLYDYCIRGGRIGDDGWWEPYQGLGIGHVLDIIGVPY